MNQENYQERRSSAFAPRELLQIAVAWVVLSVAISLSYIEGLFQGSDDITYVAAAFIATATAFIFHEMGHKFVAQRLGCVAYFRIWIWGLALALFTAIITQGNFLFGAPGAVYIAPAAGAGYSLLERHVRDEKIDNMRISAAGPGTNLAFAIFFFLLLLVSPNNGFISTVAAFGLSLNVGLGSFNMLPIPPMDGYKIFKGSIPVALAIAIPLWIMFLLFFLGV